MKKKEYLGIDVSKSKIDVRLYELKSESEFSNKLSGFKKMKRWISKQAGSDVKLLVCFEHTGMYAIPLQVFLEEEGLDYVQVSGLQVKRSLGIQRGKNDRVDAGRLAEYAYLHREKLTPNKLESKQLIRLKHLLSLRSRFVRQRAGFKSSVREYKTFLSLNMTDIMVKSQYQMIKTLTTQIELIEKEIIRLINQDQKINHQYYLATSVKGIGMITAAYMIVYTNCFKDITKWRKFACYAGSAPFDNRSGSSIQGKTRISHYANKQIKAILTSAAKSAIQYNPEIRLYYQKRIQEGKHKKIVTNIIRNKLISRVFATVNRGTPYVDIIKYAA